MTDFEKQLLSKVADAVANWSLYVQQATGRLPDGITIDGMGGCFRLEPETEDDDRIPMGALSQEQWDLINRADSNFLQEAP